MTFNPEIFFYILMAWFSMSNATVQLSRPGLTWSKRRHCRALSLLSEQTVSVSEQRLSTSARYQNLIYQPCCSPAELHRPAGWAVWYLPLFNYRKQVSLKIKSEFGRNFLTRQQKMLCFLPCSPHHCKMLKVSLCPMRSQTLINVGPLLLIGQL